MKKLLLYLITLTSAASVFAQGTVILNNNVPGVGTTHVWSGPVYLTGNSFNDIPPGSTPYAASGCILIGTVGGMTASTAFATLIGAPGSNVPESLMVPSISPPTTFRSGSGSGFVVARTDTFSNILPDAPVATFELVAWDNASGLYPTWAQASVAAAFGLIYGGHSAPFVIQSIGGNANFSPVIVSSIPGQGLQSFSITIPEPTTVALAGLGAAALLVFRRGK
jgi:hypothetical protein